VSFKYGDKTFHPNEIDIPQYDGFVQDHETRQGIHTCMELVEMSRSGHALSYCINRIALEARGAKFELLSQQLICTTPVNYFRSFRRIV
jgi:hypothetical protein